MRIDCYWNKYFMICFDKIAFMNYQTDVQKIWEKSHKTFVGKFIQCILNNLLVPEHMSHWKRSAF